MEQSWGIFELTTLGSQISSSEESILLDPEGLVQKYNDLIPGGPDLSAEYYEEAVLAYRQHLFRSSTIVLGVASETILLKTAKVIYEYRVNPDKNGEHKNKGLLDWRPARVSEILLQILRNRNFRTGLESDFHDNPLPFNEKDARIIEEASKSVNILADLYRQTRNEQGHPLGVAIDPSLLRVLIMAFPRYAEVLFDISWIVSGKPPQFRALHITSVRVLNDQQ